MAKRKKGNFIVSLVLLCLLGSVAYYLYQRLFPTVKLREKNYTYVFIKHDSTFDDVVKDLGDQGIIESEDAFVWLARKMVLDQNIHPGKFRIINGMNMRQIINLLKYNKQEKIKLAYNSQIHDMDEFVAYTHDKLELEEEELLDFLEDEKKLDTYFGLDPENSLGLVIPGTYEVGWAITADELFELLSDRYTMVWNTARKEQARRIGYSPAEVITMASIVQSESSIRSEQEKIAGVYFNRLKKGMPLQADPTLKFANKNYQLQRVLDVDKEINSPYNTYKYKGLPPGPICLVSQQAIDATLRYARHPYIFFCAKPQLNGFSDYSTTYDQHRKYAMAYQKALDKMGINR